MSSSNDPYESYDPSEADAPLHFSSAQHIGIGANHNNQPPSLHEVLQGGLNG